MVATPSILTVSIDFELFWGTRDHRSLSDYGPNVLGGRRAIPHLLELFEEFGVHATWAVVGFVLFRRKTELEMGLPKVLPEYSTDHLSPYEDLPTIGTPSKPEEYFFAPELVELIRRTPGQEIASHTFSHYYCLEDGQTLRAFEEDLAAMNAVAERALRAAVTSLVFPRNQFNEAYLTACRAAGIRAYRGNPRSWVYEAKSEREETLVRRAVRLADSYVNLTGHHAHRLSELPSEGPVDVPASRFLRPWSRRLRALEPMRLRRIQKDLTYSARNGRLYHLWWHPETFGQETSQNLAFLRRVLEHFSQLRAEYGMESLAMAEVAERLRPAQRGYEPS